jgi:membrane peptidoglycan carboxypeptidase
VRAPFATYSDAVLSGPIANKTSLIGRLITVSAVGGVIAAAMALPVVATTGVILRDQADNAAKPTSASFGTIPQRSEILDANGHLMAYVYGVNLGKNADASGLDRQPVTYSEISPSMRKAVVAIEDNRFWTEGALDVKGTLRALVNDLQHKAVQGGSSITQQYVKNMLILTAPSAQQAQAAYEETLSRKLHELRLAITVAHQQSKEQILTGYLNDAYFGNLAYGIEVAAETYFNTSAAKLTLPQAALLAGMVENPTGYNPFAKPANALERRNTVLARMVQTGVLDAKTAATAEKAPLGVQNSTPDNGCTASRAGTGAFFCNYVEHVFVNDTSVAKTPQDRAKLLATGGLTIYTTLDEEDQNATANAVNYVLPDGSREYNPANNADTEVLVQPGTGYIKAMAEDRTYSSSGTTLNYAVDSSYGGSPQGVQTGSSSKLFTLVTALEQGVPFGYTQTVPGQTTVTGFTNCEGQPVGFSNGVSGVFPVTNAEGPGSTSTQSLYTGTVQSVNTFFANLEHKVGLCNVVKTAAAMGVHRVDGTSLMKDDPAFKGAGDPADDIPSFTLGPVNVSPLTMAAAYATVAARGKYCAPVAITQITSETGKKLAVPSAGCHQAISSDVADAANYILQGVLTAPGATGAGLGIARPAAGKTGTSNVETGNGTPYAAFAGYTPTMASYTSVFNPVSPVSHPMVDESACYHEPGVGQHCVGEMFGADAPGHTWQLTFEHANLGSAAGFVGVPGTSPLLSMGNGQSVKQPAKPKGKGKGKTTTTNCVFFVCTGTGNNGGGNGNGGGANGGPVH